MSRNQRYEAVLRTRPIKYMPKKLLKHTKISINKHYTANVCLWIPNTPEYNLKPGVVLKLQHNDQDIRLCFNNAADMIMFVEDLRKWVGSLAATAHLKQEEAIREWLAFHENQLTPPINDYTDSTVIQEESQSKKKTQNRYGARRNSRR